MYSFNILINIVDDAQYIVMSRIHEQYTEKCEELAQYIERLCVCRKYNSWISQFIVILSIYSRLPIIQTSVLSCVLSELLDNLNKICVIRTTDVGRYTLFLSTVCIHFSKLPHSDTLHIWNLKKKKQIVFYNTRKMWKHILFSFLRAEHVMVMWTATINDERWTNAATAKARFACVRRCYVKRTSKNDYGKFLTHKNFHPNPNRTSLKMFSHQKIE